MEVQVNTSTNRVNTAEAAKLPVGTVMLGPHTVRIGKNPPLRLDKVGHSPIKSLGFKRTVRLGNATTGMSNQTNVMLNALKSPDGSFPAESLVRALNTFNQYATHYLKSGVLGDPAMLTVTPMTQRVSQLSNADITHIYATLLSQDMDDLKMAMEYEARTNPKARNDMVAGLSLLGDLEALVVSEASKRSALAAMRTNAPGQETPVTTLEQQFGTGNQAPQVTQRGTQDLGAADMATAMQRTAENAADVRNLILNLLKREDHDLHADSLLQALASFTQHAHNQDQDPESFMLKSLAHTVSQLTNTELTQVYTTLLSQDMDALKKQLELKPNDTDANGNRLSTGLGVLSDLEALVVSEASKRTAMANQQAASPDAAVHITTLDEQYGNEGTAEQVTHRGENDLRAPGMAAIMERAAISATRLKNAEQQVAQIAHDHNMTPTDLKNLGDVMRNAELTINIPTEFLFGDGKNPEDFAVNDPDFGVKNTYQLDGENASLASADYKLLRQSTEDALFPTLQGHVTGKERPIYGSLNNLHSMGGAGFLFGRAVLVLKPELKQTATYTYGSSIGIPYVSLNEGKIPAFIQSLLQYRDALTTDTQKALQNPDSDLRRDISSLFATKQSTTLDQLARTPAFASLKENLKFQPQPQGVGIEQDYFIQNSLLKTCQDKDRNFQLTASYDHLETLLPAMGEGNVLQLAVAHQDHRPQVQFSGPQGHLYGQDYIEAQLPKPMNLRQDVAEIRMVAEDYTKAARNNIMNWSEQAGVKVTFIPHKTFQKATDRAITEAAKNAHKVKSMNLDKGMQDALRMLRDIAPMEQAKARVDGHPQHERLQRLTGGTAFVSGGLAEQLEAQLLQKCDQYLAASELGTLTPETVKSFADQTIAELIDRKVNLLLKLDEYSFPSDANKIAFANWIRESATVNSEGEMQLLHDRMIQNANRLLHVLRGPEPPSPQNLMQAIQNIQQENHDVYMDFFAEVRTLREPDIMAEFHSFADLTVTYLKNLPDGDTKLQHLASLIDSPEFKTYQAVYSTIPDKNDTSYQADVRSIRMLGTYLDSLAQATAKALDKPTFSQLAPIDLKNVPRPLRTKLFGFMSDSTLKFVNDTWRPNKQSIKIATSFPLPGNNAVPPHTLNQRRDFLKQMLTHYHHQDADARTSDTYGRTHAVRVFVFANALSNIMKQRGVNVDTNAVSFAAAALDTGRKTADDDSAAARSADICQQAVQQTLQNPSKDYLDAITACLTPSPDAEPTLEALLVQSAATMDAQRLGPIDLSNFPFLGNDLIHSDCLLQPDQRLRQQLLKEANILACLTSPAAGARRAMEQLEQEIQTGDNQSDAQNRLNALKNAVQQETAQRAQNETDQQVIDRIETIIRNNQTLFPLLRTYGLLRT